MKILNKMNELRMTSSNLRRVAFNTKDLKKAEETRKMQDDYYKRFMFYKNLSKSLNEAKVNK